MALSLGISFPNDAKAAAQEFIKVLDGQSVALENLSDEIKQFNSSGKLVGQTFKTMGVDGKEIEVTLRRVKGEFQLVGTTVNKATESLRRYKEQQKQLEIARRTDIANSAEADLARLPGARNIGSAAQASAVEAAFQRVRAAILSGTVTLERFKAIYDQLQANPKAILPNLTADEAKIASAIRSLQTGFVAAGSSAKDFNAQLQSMAGFIGRIFSSQVIGRVTGFLSQALNEGIETAKQFSIQIAEIQTISQRAGVTTEEWVSGLRRLSSQFGNSQADVATAAYNALSNQVTRGADTFQFLASAAKFGQASVSSLADAVNLGSSAIRSFNLPVSDSEKIFASFFKTIDLGRITAREIANNFGRVAGVASQAGVSLDELNATLAVITNKGIEAHEAMTLINNVMLKLVRPTDEMKTLFNEWGVASGTAAIQTFGFAGVLQKLSQEAEKGGARLGELFNEMRGFRGISFLANASGFQEFNDVFEQIKGSRANYDNAAKIVSESFGQRFKVEMNKIAVFFTEEFGDQVVRGTLNLADNFGGLSNVIKNVTEAIVLASKAGSAYFSGLILARTAITAYNAVTVTQTTVTTAQTVATEAATIAENARAKSIAATNAAISTFGAGFTIGFMINEFVRFDRLLESVSEKTERLNKEITKINEQSKLRFIGDQGRDPEIRQQDAIFDAVRTNFNKRYQLALLYYSQQQKLSNELKERTTQNLNQITERTKVASKTFFDSITNQLSDLRKASQEAEQMIRDSLKSQESLTRKTTDEIFSKRLSFASEGQIDSSGFVIGEQKTALIKARIAELQQLANDKFREGTQESVTDARRLYDEIRQQQSNLLDAQISRQKREFEESVRRGEATPTGTDFDPITGKLKDRYEFIVRTADFERQINATKQQQIAAEERLRSVQAARLKDIERQEASEKEKLRTAQQAFEILSKISVLDKEGKIKDQYKDTTIRLPGEKPINIPGGYKALEEFDRQADIIRQAAAGKDLATQAQVNSTLLQQRQALAQQIEAVATDARIRGEAQRLEISKNATNQQITAAREKYDQANASLAESTARLQSKLIQIRDFDAEGRDATAGFSDLETKLKTFSSESTVKNFERLSQEFAAFTQRYQRWVENTQGKSITDMIDTPQLERFMQLQKAFEDLSSARNTRQNSFEAINQIDSASNQLRDTISGLPNAWEILDRTISSSGPTMTQNINTITNSAMELLQNLEGAVERLRQLNTEVPQLKMGLQVAPGGNFGGPVKYLSGGGFVGFKPRGSDTVPAMLNPDEFVMTSQATKRFEPVLRAMNAMSPEYMAKGGSPVNVGDVNVTVNGGNTAPQTIREVAKGLRRGIRNKTITLK